MSQQVESRFIVIVIRYGPNERGPERFQLSPQKKETISILYAELFPTREAATEVMGVYLSKMEGDPNIIQVRVVELPISTTYRVLKHQLRLRAKELFRLRGNSPAWLVADRYDDAGMEEEAEILRTKIGRNVI